MALIDSLLLLLAANGAPVLARTLLGERGAVPIDGGRRFVDGRPWLGASKTWRGLLAALLVTAPLAALLGPGWATGALFALLAMLGDLLASFTKRRLGIPASGRARLLDQIPEALLPTALLHDALGLDWIGVAAVVAAFTLLDLLVSPLLYRLHIRRRPY